MDNEIVLLFLTDGNYLHDINNYGGSLAFKGNSTFVKSMKNYGGDVKGDYKTLKK